MKRLTIFAALGAALIAGCGGSSPSTPHPAPPPVKVIQGHQCSPRDEALQCVLPPVPPKLNLAPSPFARGVDFAWGAPSAARMRANGWTVGASYLSHDRSKGWQQRPGLVSEYHRAGIQTVAVWETTANRAGEGCSAGRTDAFYAARQAAEVGNTDRPIMFAIDFDAQGFQVDGYFRCIHHLLGSRTNAYGSYYALKYLCSHGLVGHQNWQTYAWSRGQWLPASCAPLQQYLNDSSVDYDRAIAADFGQWPAASKPPVSKRVLRERLRYHEGRQATIRALLLKHKCGRPPHLRRLHACKVWIDHGNIEVGKIAYYHSKGV